MKLTANPASKALPVQQRRRCFEAQLLRIMKLTTIIILAACLQSAANGVAQNTVTISGKEVSLDYVFNAIKKQTSYRFFFNTDMLQHTSKVTIEVKNAPIDQVMHLALKDQPLTFAIKGRTIFIMKKEEEKSSSQQLPPSGDPITVSGRVTDDQGLPLVGANVKVKGTNTGATTDNQGRFTLNGVDPNAMLEISFVGHETQLLQVKGKSVFTVALGQKQSILDETVVIAYGTTTKRFNTGNVSSVKSVDIERQPVNNPLLALQGRIPGMVITQATGLPGSGVQVQIRGLNSIANNNYPLYIIDGVPYISSNPTNLGGTILGTSNNNGAEGGNPLSYLNPNDIESIDVLKDADATSIYGSRGANGVVLITTKRGKYGKVKVDVNIQSGIGQVNKKVELLNTEQYLEMRHEAFQNDGAVPGSTAFDLVFWDTTRYTDWQKILIGNNARYNNAQLSLSGGGNNTTYLVSGGYHKETTVFPSHFSNQQGSLHFNLTSASSNQKFRFVLSSNYNFNDNRLPRTDLTAVALTMAPDAPSLYNSDGTINWSPGSNGRGTFKNPIAQLANKYKSVTNNIIANTILSYEFFPGLEIKTSVGYNNINSNDAVLNPAISRDPATWVQLGNNLRRSSFSNSRVSSWIIEPQLTFKRNFLKGLLTALIGSTIQQNKTNAQIINTSGFSSDLLIEDPSSAATFTNGGTSYSQYKYNALFGRISSQVDIAEKSIAISERHKKRIYAVSNGRFVTK